MESNIHGDLEWLTKRICTFEVFGEVFLFHVLHGSDVVPGLYQFVNELFLLGSFG